MIFDLATMINWDGLQICKEMNVAQRVLDKAFRKTTYKLVFGKTSVIRWDLTLKDKKITLHQINFRTYFIIKSVPM